MRRGHFPSLHPANIRLRGMYIICTAEDCAGETGMLPLRSFVDLWNKKLLMGNVQKLNLYMNAHPQANILEVLREHNFRYIPFEVKIRYNMDRKVKLYD